MMTLESNDLRNESGNTSRYGGLAKRTDIWKHRNIDGAKGHDLEVTHVLYE